MLTGSGGGIQDYGAGQPIIADQDRLYPTVDDFFYNGTFNSSSSGTYSSTNRLPNGMWISGTVSSSGTTVPVLPASFISKARFFLTADSKSPETNAFNLPRVCMWPITKTGNNFDNPDTSSGTVTSTMTAFDRIIAFCATVSGTTSGLANRVPFYFSRYDAFSQTHDYNGPTGSGSNNPNLYTYLHSLMALPFPGLSASSNATFVTKYPSEDLGPASGNQILTEIFDYIRCTNLADCSDDVYGTTPYGATSYTYVNPNFEWVDQGWYSQTSQGQVVPIVIPTSAVSGTAGVLAGTSCTRGIGRIANIGEMTLVMVKEDERMNSADTENTGETQIVVSSTNQTYGGTWPYVAGYKQQNNINVLVKETTKNTVYASGSYPGGHTPPTSDVLLLPGAGGFANSGTTNTYDPRKQTKIQFALLPYYFCPMAGFSAISQNQRLHFTQVTLNVVSTSGTTTGTTTAVAPAKSGTYTSGTQGQDLYDSGRIDTINQFESKVGGPMGPKSLIDASSSTVQPTNIASPTDSVCPVVEAVIGGTSASSGGFSGSGSNTMSVSGTVVVQTMAPGISGTWSARNINDPPAVIQTSTFVFPSAKTIPSSGTYVATVQIPTLRS